MPKTETTEARNADLIGKIRFIIDRTAFDDGEKLFNIQMLINEALNET